MAFKVVRHDMKVNPKKIAPQKQGIFKASIVRKAEGKILNKRKPRFK